VQAKCVAGTVGHRAVEQAHGAQTYYSADAAIVVTHRAFHAERARKSAARMSVKGIATNCSSD
jgi:HJR/Mrr/RecB family endonuclease